MIRHALHVARALVFVPLLAIPACTRTIPLGSDQTNGSAQGGGGSGVTGGSAGAGASAGSIALGGRAGGSGGDEAGDAGSAGTCVPATCHGTRYACGNCKDDDGDGKIDAEDPECTGPCDDREDSFDVGLPGSSADKCAQDCFFDNGNGAGHDDCRYSHRCDPVSVAPDYPPTGLSACAYDPNAKVPGGSETCAELAAEQSDACSSVCGPLTPNGCDCFGCCEIPPGSFHYVGLGMGAGACTSENIDDPVACPPCSPVEACMNHCEACESCVGRPEPLASCNGETDACEGLFTPCDPTAATLCPPGSYCITGCCIPEPR